MRTLRLEWVIACVLLAGLQGEMQAQALFADALQPVGGEGIAVVGEDDSLYVSGIHAIHEARWAEAESIFAKVIEHHHDHVEGALYWKAYAENKLKRSEEALKTCSQLRTAYPKSRWIDDCDALEIEIRGNSGQIVEPQKENDVNLKVLALGAQIRLDEKRALPQIQKMLEGNQPESVKESVLFVLAQSQSKKAHQMLAGIAQPSTETSANIRSNTALQARARQLVAALQAASDARANKSVVRRTGMDVMVSDSSDKPLSGLTAADFTVQQKGQPAKILQISEQDVAEVMILIDTVNSSLVDVAYERDQVAIYLRSNGGHLAHPTSILFLRGDGAKPIAPTSQDGNALANALHRADTNLHPVKRSEGFYGSQEKIDLSIRAMTDLALQQWRRPGRKMLVWISPGWQYLARSEAMQTGEELRFLYDTIVALSTDLRLARITLYSIDPNRFTGASLAQWSRYRAYLKPVTRENDADVGDLALQALAEQSGGRAILTANLYLWEQVAKCIADSASGYYLEFDTSPSQQKNDFHAIKVTVDKPGAVVRTRSGFYNQP